MLYTPSNQIRPLIAAIVDSYSREKYLDSSPWIIAELHKMGAQVRMFHLTDERLAPKLLGFSPDLIWPMGLGPYAEDGRLQGFIETLLPGTPYVGSGVAASALGMDKEYFQAMCQTLDIAVAKSVCYTTFFHPHGRSCRVSKPGDALFLTKEGQPFYLTLVEHLGTPLVVKPLHGGASLDVAVVRSAEEFEAAFHNASCSGPALVQAYIAGVEYSICLLETVSPLPICEVWHEAIHDTQSKVDGASERIPALLDPDIAAHLDAQARALYELLDCHGPCRFDVKINPEGRPVFLEVNTNPGLIPGVSIFPKVCEVAGLEYQTLIRKILSTGLLSRRRETRRLSAAEAAPFPVAFRSRLPNLPAELQPPVYQALAAEAHEAPVMATIRHAC